jgi:hypothetical protein
MTVSRPAVSAPSTMNLSVRNSGAPAISPSLGPSTRAPVVSFWLVCMVAPSSGWVVTADARP